MLVLVHIYNFCLYAYIIFFFRTQFIKSSQCVVCGCSACALFRHKFWIKFDRTNTSEKTSWYTFGIAFQVETGSRNLHIVKETQNNGLYSLNLLLEMVYLICKLRSSVPLDLFKIINMIGSLLHCDTVVAVEIVILSRWCMSKDRNDVCQENALSSMFILVILK